MDNLDWSLVRAFLAVAEQGSLSGAARVLGASQPTLGRQIRALEDQLQAELFLRQPRGLVLSDTGAALMVPARAMQAAMQQIALTAAGQQTALEGTVRITASVIASAYLLPSIIAQIRAAEPAIQIELVPTDDSRNLTYREADIAVRMYRPTQLDLVTQHLGDLELALFASNDYIARRGMPTVETMMDHDFVGYDTDQRIIDGFAAAGFDLTPDFFGVRCDDPLSYFQLVRAGCGVGFHQAGLLEGDDAVTRIDIGIPLPKLPVWLTAHETMRQTPRIRRVWNMLRDGLAPLVA
ncbi:LysR family transcriptional regulator [Yoonia sp. R2331]|uniref:LysR family transcriptional regulator n=1 Tax=Yoonia sp. R2331 TaxID=3237238 RepID=UPI0034E46D35